MTETNIKCPNSWVDDGSEMFALLTFTWHYVSTSLIFTFVFVKHKKRTSLSFLPQGETSSWIRRSYWPLFPPPRSHHFPSSYTPTLILSSQFTGSIWATMTTSPSSPTLPLSPHLNIGWIRHSRHTPSLTPLTLISTNISLMNNGTKPLNS